MIHPLRLGVNIDHVATIRNARGGVDPDPVRAALAAQEAGAEGITAHLREDRRHITDKDIALLKKHVHLPLNLEMAATKEMLEIALKTEPNAVCIVPEKRKELTTEGGLDVMKHQKTLKPYITKLREAGIRVSLFIDPVHIHIDVAKSLEADIIELHTGTFCNLPEGKKQEQELMRLRHSADYADSLGLEVHAGHGLNYHNVQQIASIAPLTELNIGHFIIGEAIFRGLERTIKKMRRLMQDARKHL